jgi:hypothetical protein
MGIIIQCKDDGPLIEWGESSTSTNEGDGAGTDFEGGFFDVNSCELDKVLDSIADFLKDIFGGGDDGGGGGETPPPEGGDGGGDDPGGETDGGDEPPPEDGENPPPEGGGGDSGEESGVVIDVSGTSLTYVKLYRPVGSSSQRLVVPRGTYRRVGDAITVPTKRIRRRARADQRR